MKEVDRVQHAKRDVLEAAGEKPWLSSVGVGKLEDRLVLIVSVRKGAKARAVKLIESLTLDVPIEVREVGPVRAR